MDKFMLLTKSPSLQRPVLVSVFHRFNHNTAITQRVFKDRGYLWRQSFNCVETYSLSTSSLHHVWKYVLHTCHKSRQEWCFGNGIWFGCNASKRSILGSQRSGHVFSIATIRPTSFSCSLTSLLTAVDWTSNTVISVSNIKNNFCHGKGSHLIASEHKTSSFISARNKKPYTANLLHPCAYTKSDLLPCVRTLKKCSMFGSGNDAQSHSTLTFAHQSCGPSLSRRQSLYTCSQILLQPAKSTSTGPAFRSLHTLDHFTLKNVSYSQYLESLVSECKDLVEARLKGEHVDHSHLMFLESVAMTVEELQSASADVLELQTILSGEEDRELQTLARDDVENMQEHIEQLQKKLVYLLAGLEPADKNDVMLEVSAAVGGQEAMLFTAEMFDMYAGYADFKGWTFGVVELEKSDAGGLRRASALITGEEVYKHLKFEAGVHRVQRVPKTEKAGRIHTSTMTVAVLPQPSQVDISVNPKDLHIDTFRAGGAGGQHVNKTESAVRITHKPSGTVAECQQDRSQVRNRDLAMKILLSRLYQKQVEEQEAALHRKRKLQVGTAGRSEKIRTYNYSQDRITDHRGPVTFYGVSLFLSGEEAMDDLISSLMLQSRLEVLAAMVDEYVEAGQKGKRGM